jgi:hypothetical protein
MDRFRLRDVHTTKQTVNQGLRATVSAFVSGMIGGILPSSYTMRRPVSTIMALRCDSLVALKLTSEL